MIQWIKCSDRMPEQGQLVQIITVKKRKPMRRALAEYWMPEPGVHDDDTPGWFVGDDEVAAPTHWMPLPEPPEAD